MKTLLTLSILIALSGCSLSIQRLPTPIEPELAKIINELGASQKQHAQNLDVLIADYKERHPEVKK